MSEQELPNPFVAYAERYRYDPVGWAEQELGFVADESRDPSLSDGQADVLRGYAETLIELRDRPDDLTTVRQIAVRSGHGPGKTTVISIIISHHMTFFFPQRVVCTSATEKQLFDALASEVKAWLKKLPPYLRPIMDIKTEKIEHSTRPEESYISFRTSSKENPEALAGVHSEHVLLVGDEASGIPDAIFEAAAGSMSGHHAITILAGNPVRPQGFFYDIFHRPEVGKSWRTYHLDCRYSPRVSEAFVRSMAERYGEDSNAFRVRVMGEFPLRDADSFIARELAQAAVDRDVEPVADPYVIWGLDPGYKGADNSVLCRREGNLVLPLSVWAQLDGVQLAGRVKVLWDDTELKRRPKRIFVDSVGFGASATDALRALGLPVVGINVGETRTLTRPDRYANFKAELWDRAREWLNRRDVKLPDDPDFLDELTGVGFDISNGGKLVIEPKKSVRRRLKGSPDRADAFVLTFVEAASLGAHGVTALERGKKPVKRNLRWVA